MSIAGLTGLADRGQAVEPPPGTAHIAATIGDHVLAVEMAALVEVAELGTVAEVPLAPAWLLGVTSLHGGPVPVVDLATFLGWVPLRTLARALVLRDGRHRVAVPVDTVQAVRWLELEPLAQNGHAPVPGGVVKRVVEVGATRVTVVDVDVFLDGVRHGGSPAAAGR